MKNIKTAGYVLRDRNNLGSHSIYGSISWKRLLHLSGWVIGAIALYAFLTRYFEWNTFHQELSHADWRILIIAICAYIVGLVVRAVRWTYMVRCHQELSWVAGYHVIMISNMANFLFPVRLGEILKLIIVKKICGVAYCSSTAASIVEKLTIFLIIIAFLSLTPFAGYHFSDWSAKFFPFLIILLLISAGFLFLGSSGIAGIKYTTEKLLRMWGMSEKRIQRILTNRLAGYLESTMRQCHISTYSGTKFLWIASLGLVTLLLDGLANYALISAFGLELSYLQAVIAACFFNVLFLLPSPPVQVGTAEMFPVLIYSVGLKLASPVVATSALVWHMMTVLILILLGFVSLYAVGLRIGSVIDMANQKVGINEDIS